MSVPTNTYTEFASNATKQIREDLSPKIYNVDPYKTPVLNMAKKAKATNTFHEWTVDVIPAQGSNAQIAGDDAAADQLYAAGRLGNYTQISRKVVQIDGSLQATNTVGKFGSMGYQLLKASKALKRDMEYGLTNNAASAVGAAGTARVSGGLPAWLTVNTVHQTGGSPNSGADPSGVTAAGNSINFGNGTTARTDDSSTAALTETQVRTLALDVYKNSAETIEYLVMSPKNKQVVSTFTGPAGTRFNQIEDKVFHTAIDRYETDFGLIKVVPDIFLAQSGDCYAINPQYLRVAFLRPFETVPLAKTGDADRKMLIVEYTLEVGNEKAEGGIFDTTG